MPKTKRRRRNTSSKKQRTLNGTDGRHCRKDDKKYEKRSEDKRVDKRKQRNIKANKSPLSNERIRKSPTLKGPLDSEHHRLLCLPGLCPSVGPDEIFDHFGSFGIVERVKVRSRSNKFYYALILYALRDSIERAINANPHQFGDQQYFCHKTRQGQSISSKKHHRPRESQKEEPKPSENQINIPSRSSTTSSNLPTDLEYPFRSYLYVASCQSQSNLWLNNTAEEKTTDATPVWPKSVQILRDLRLRESPLLAKKTNLPKYGKHGPATPPKLVKARLSIPLKTLPPPSPPPTMCNQGNLKMDKSDACVLAWSSLYENYQFVRHSYVDPTIAYGQEVPIEHRIELTADKYAAITYLGRELEYN
ncbi:uncharacterized protein LOC111519271 [Drosophila willistoni]|uniref:uncharacterized protein LOC111519271 n=1 Tax=Drosophila willistoni TaxID=7260 RepID=UPI000C26D4A6|nr:uncharacterized protein LOC111519271 [Drosophila willistoni]